MKKTITRTWLCLFLISVILLDSALFNIDAITLNESEASNQETIASNDTSFSSNSVSLPVTQIENNAIYAISNYGSGMWASTANTAATVDTHNLFQVSSWINTAQNFKFVETAENTFIIYPLGYNNNNADCSKALFCNYEAIETNSSLALNVYPADYSASLSHGFEWLIQYEYGGYFTIRLKKHPNYCLTVLGTNVGSPSASGVYDTGNIIACYVDPAYSPISSMLLWKPKYVIPNGTYFIKNRGDGSYLHTTDASLSQTLQKDYEGTNYQKWTISHYQNGKYCISTQSAQALTIKNYTPVNNEHVYVEVNMYQTRFWWYIDKMASGSFKIQCVTTEDYDYALKSGNIASNKQYVVSGEYIEDTDYSDEWYIYSKVFGIVNYYDSTIKRNNTLLENIDDATDFAVSVYSNLFTNIGIAIEPIGSPQYYEDVYSEKAMADQCTLLSRYPCENNADTCGDWCRLDHEKNIYNMAQQLYDNVRQENYIYVLWANRPDKTYCDTPLWSDENDHVVLEGILATVTGIEDDLHTEVNEHYLYPAINFLTIDQDTDEQNLACMSILLVHELAHTFQMDDVYNNTGHDKENKFICVMEKYESNMGISTSIDVSFYNRIKSDTSLAFCSSCYNTLKPLIQQCHHEANP